MRAEEDAGEDESKRNSLVPPEAKTTPENEATPAVEESNEELRIMKLLAEQKDLFTLDLSRQQLDDMRLITEDIRAGRRNYVSTLDLSQNQLTELNLVGVPTLLTLRAPKNCLKKVNLALSALQVLDLSNNSLEEIPRLYDMLKLDELYLGRNLISKFDPMMIPPTITILDMSDNQISLAVEDYEGFIKGFKRFVYLEQLLIDKNEFNMKFTNYTTRIAQQCPTLKSINKNAVIKSEELFIKSEDTTDKKQAKESLANEPTPTLKMMFDCVETARKYPPSCQLQINTLMHYTEVLRRTDERKVEQDCSDMTMQRNLFESLDMLHSSQPKYRKYICIVLARLATITRIGDGAMMQLTKFIRSSRALSEEIQPIISEHIVKKLNEIDDPKDFPLEILDRFCRASKELDISTTLMPLVPKFATFAIQREKLSNPTMLRLMMGIIAAAVKGKRECVSMLVPSQSVAEQAESKRGDSEQGFLIALRGMFQKPNMQAVEYSEALMFELEQYQYVLEIIEYCSRHSRDAAALLYSRFHVEFLNALESSFQDYDALSNDKQEKANNKQTIRICEVFAAEINAFSGILNTSAVKDIEKVLRNSKRDIIRRILGIVTQARVDPKVLAATCRFALGLFKTEAVLKNNALMVQYTKEMRNIAGLMDYLGRSRWADLCKEAAKYHPGITKGRSEVPLQEIKQPFIFDTFSAIIDLINFFCAQNRNKGLVSYHVIQEVNIMLDKAEREDALFNTLKLNDDNVRLAVVECLNNVPLQQFSSDEMGRMVSLLTAYKNPTSGRTEIVLGKLLWILTKIVMDESDEVGKEFRKTQARTAIKECVNILMNDYNQMVQGDEQEEKLFLGISCVHFLKACSGFPELRRLLSDFTDQYCFLLKADEDSLKCNTNYCRIEVERTALGSTIHNNISSFLSSHTLDQYSEVCLRVLQTMGDVLCSPVIEYEIPHIFPEEQPTGEDEQPPAEVLKEYLLQSQERKNAQECEHWPELAEIWKRFKKESASLRDDLQREIKVFVDNEMIEILLNYLMGSCAHRCAGDLEPYLESFAGTKLRYLRLRREMEDKVPDIRRQFQERQTAMLSETGSSPDSKTKFVSKNPLDAPAKDVIVAELEKEQLAYNKDHSEPIFDRGISLQADVSASKGKEEFQASAEATRPYRDKRKRALCIAAFMRCVFNVYAYNDAKGRGEVLKKLRNRGNLMRLTQLCFTTDWLEANIGAKYLRLCQLILTIDPEQNYADRELLDLSEIACTAAREIMQFMFDRIKNEDKVPFTPRENLLLVELASFGRCVCQLIPYLPYLAMERKSEKEEKKALSAVDGVPSEEDSSYFVVPPKSNRHDGSYLPAPQYLCAEYTLSQLLPYKSMYTFTLMLFYFTRKLDEYRNNPDKVAQLHYIEEARAATVFALGSYMSLCKREKYQFLDEIMKQCVYEKKYIRKSYIQEILTLMHNFLIVTAIEAFIFEHSLKRKGEKERVRSIVSCHFALQGESSLKRALLVVTARSVYLFAPFSKQCTRCPIEKVCWTPEIVADPIPMSSIEYIVDMEGVPMLALAMKTRSGLFSFGGFRKQILVVQARDYLAKNEIVNSLGLSTTLNVAPDPVFSEFFANRIEDFQGAQMVGASSDSPQPRKSALADEEIRSPHMMVVTREKLRFFRVGFGAWKFLDAPVDGSTPAEEEETKDGPGKKKSRKEIMEEMMRAAFVEDTGLALRVADVSAIREKDDKDPTLLLCFKGKRKLFLTFASDFGLQAFVNLLSPLLGRK